MKRLILILLIFLSFNIFLCVYSQYREDYSDYFTLKKNYSYIYEENRKMEFEIFTTSNDSLITYEDINSYSLKLNDLVYSLENVESKYSYIDDVSLIIISCDVISTMDEIYSDSAKLIIKNSTFNLNLDLGSMSILNPKEFRLLSVDYLYASYSYIQNQFILTGINLKLTNNYNKIYEAKIGKYSYGILDKIIYDKEFENEIIISNEIHDYSLYDYLSIGIAELESNIIFIPIAYERLGFIDEGYITMILDGEKYYLDTFPFISNNINYELYKDALVKGEIKYASID